jgi:poly(3-hydroxybutyrate) depolymerase
MATILAAWTAVMIGQTEIPRGSAKLDVSAGAVQLEVFTYKPESYKAGPMILVFHGVLRNADEYRDHARKMGDRCGALIVAPKFDAERFPNTKYQQGGVVSEGRVTPREAWTWHLISQVAAEIRKREQRPDLPYYLIGHSGGGQFLVRMAGFVPTAAERIVAANPGTHLFPRRDLDYPYGFGGLTESTSSDEVLKRYLAQPLTIYLGTEDTIQDEYFEKSEAANRQGNSRYQRGRNSFREARELAQRKGWNCAWRLVEAPGVGHDHEAMFNHAQCDIALFGRDANAE